MIRLCYILEIIVIEDDSLLNNQITKKLENEGLPIKSFLNGKDALYYLLDKNNFLMILDYKLPDFYGLDLVKELKKFDIDFNFIITSGVGDEKLVVDSMKLGARDYIVKDLNFLNILPSSVIKTINDIENETRYDEIEKQLKKDIFVANERLNYLLKSCYFVMYSSDFQHDYKMNYISENVIKILGYHDKDFIDEPQIRIKNIHPDDKTKLLFAMENLIKTNNVVIEYRFKSKSDQYIWIRDEITLVHDAENNPIEIIGYWINITEQKEAEIKLIKQNKFNFLKSEIWKVAVEKYNSEEEFIKKLLDTIGPILDASRLSYLRFDKEKNGYTPVYQWHKNDTNSTLGLIIPYFIIEKYFNRRFVEIPKDLTDDIKEEVIKRITHEGIKTFIGLPYGDLSKPEGYFTISDCEYLRNWTDFEKDLLEEVIKIVKLKADQIKADQIKAERNNC